MNNISIIIVTYNSADVIESCLQSLHLDGGAEVVVIDNASSDITCDLIRRKYPKIKLMKNKKNIGFAAAANQGFAVSSGESVIFLNPDTVLQGNFVGCIYDYLENNPDVSILGCRLTDLNGKSQVSCWKKPSVTTIFLESFLPYESSLPLISELPGTTMEVDMVSGACLVIRRFVFETIGRFDERFFMYYEDADLCLRARLAGYKIFYYPELNIVHRVSQSIGSDLDSFFRMIYSSKILFVRKHFQLLQQIFAVCFILAGIIMRIPLYGLVGLINAKFIKLAKSHLNVLRRILYRQSN